MSSKKLNKDLLNNLGSLFEEVFTASTADIKKFLGTKDVFEESDEAKKVGEVTLTEAALLLIADKKFEAMKKLEDEHEKFMLTKAFTKLKPAQQEKKNEEVGSAIEILRFQMDNLITFAWASIFARLHDKLGNYPEMGQDGALICYKYPICPGCKKRHDPNETEVIAVLPSDEGGIPFLKPVTGQA
jgi:glutaredoxin-related protein